MWRQRGGEGGSGSSSEVAGARGGSKRAVVWVEQHVRDDDGGRAAAKVGEQCGSSSNVVLLECRFYARNFFTICLSLCKRQFVDAPLWMALDKSR
jgi:hypothetical protein